MTQQELHYQVRSRTFLIWILVLIYFLSNFQVQSQTIEWAPIGAKWWYISSLKCNPCGGSGLGYTTLEATRDTLINGAQAKIIQIDVGPGVFDTSELYLANTFVVKQDEQKLLLFVRDSFRVLYDFSLQPGDTLISAFPLDILMNYWPTLPMESKAAAYLVVKIDTVEIDSRDLRKMIVEPLSGGDYGREIIEGIGGSEFFMPYHTCGLCSGSFQGYRGLRCYESPGLVYKTDPLPCDAVTVITATEEYLDHHVTLEVYPNPSSGRVWIRNPKDKVNAKDVTIYNLQGRKLHLSISSTAPDELIVDFVTPGIYMVRYKHQGHYGAKRLIIIPDN